jgi:hypothetical protein
MRCHPNLSKRREGSFVDYRELSSYIKEEARTLGFDLVGIAPAGPFEET